MFWAWSDDPSDWAVQATALFTGVAAVFTAYYAFLTRRMAAATVGAVRVTLEQKESDRVALLLPIKVTLEQSKLLLSALSHLQTDQELAAARELVNVEIELAKACEVAKTVSQELFSRLYAARQAIADTAAANTRAVMIPIAAARRDTAREAVLERSAAAVGAVDIAYAVTCAMLAMQKEPE